MRRLTSSSVRTKQIQLALAWLVGCFSLYRLYMSAIISTSSSAASCCAFMGSIVSSSALTPPHTHTALTTNFCRPGDPLQLTGNPPAAAAAASLTFKSAAQHVRDVSAHTSVSIKLDSNWRRRDSAPSRSEVRLGGLLHENGLHVNTPLNKQWSLYLFLETHCTLQPRTDST